MKTKIKTPYKTGFPHYIDKMSLADTAFPYAKIFQTSLANGRLETVARIGRVEFVNDVTADTINSVYYALNRLQGPLVWIVCNDNENMAWEELSQVMVYKTHHIVACGAAAAKLDALYGSRIPVSTARDIQDAIDWSLRVAKPGTKVLFSPGTDRPCGMESRKADKLFRKILFKMERQQWL